MVSVAQAQHDGHTTGGGAERPWSQADEYWGASDMVGSQSAMLHHHGMSAQTALMVDRLELQNSDDVQAGVWDADIWHGGDLNKLWIKTEGAYDFEHGAVEEAEVQLLWSRAVLPFFDVQTGLRHDFEPSGRTHAVIGLQGETPYRIKTDGALFLSQDGDLTAGLELEYELALTQRLHLSPRAELSWSAQESRDMELGEGFTHAEFGMRLSYDVIREFSPYVGVEWQGSLGETKDLIRAAGSDADRTVFLIGIKGWY